MCGICKDSFFRSQEKVVKHLLKHHSSVIFKCSKCFLLFNTNTKRHGCEDAETDFLLFNMYTGARGNEAEDDLNQFMRNVVPQNVIDCRERRAAGSLSSPSEERWVGLPKGRLRLVLRSGLESDEVSCSEDSSSDTESICLSEVSRSLSCESISSPESEQDVHTCGDEVLVLNAYSTGCDTDASMLNEGNISEPQQDEEAQRFEKETGEMLVTENRAVEIERGEEREKKDRKREEGMDGRKDKEEEEELERLREKEQNIKKEKQDAEKDGEIHVEGIKEEEKDCEDEKSMLIETSERFSEKRLWEEYMKEQSAMKRELDYDNEDELTSKKVQRIMKQQEIGQRITLNV